MKIYSFDTQINNSCSYECVVVVELVLKKDADDTQTVTFVSLY